MKKIYENKKLILIIGGIIILILSLILYLVNNNKKVEDDIVLNITTESITTKKEDKESFYVDIKGNVNNPGVYKFTTGDRVIDAIEVENTNLININKASLEELLTLTGIGESKAKSIIEYRDTNGNFKDINELKNVSGIGDALFEKIKDKISV